MTLRRLSFVQLCFAMLRSVPMGCALFSFAASARESQKTLPFLLRCHRRYFLLALWPNTARNRRRICQLPAANTTSPLMPHLNSRTLQVPDEPRKCHGAGCVWRHAAFLPMRVAQERHIRVPRGPQCAEIRVVTLVITTSEHFYEIEIFVRFALLDFVGIASACLGTHKRKRAIPTKQKRLAVVWAEQHLVHSGSPVCHVSYRKHVKSIHR